MLSRQMIIDIDMERPEIDMLPEYVYGFKPPYMPSAKTWDFINHCPITGVSDDMGIHWVNGMNPDSRIDPAETLVSWDEPDYVSMRNSDRNKAESLVSWDDTDYTGMRNSDRENAKTLVWWDINACPVPDGCNARLVRPSIERALNKSGYSGPVSITAIGNLKLASKQSPHVLREIVSTGGIFLEHCRLDPCNALMEVCDWALDHPPPANLMLIFGDMVCMPRSLDFLLDRGYNILLAYPRRRSPTLLWAMEGLPTQEWVWESLLQDSMDPQDLQFKCTETHESHWHCSLCYFSGQCFDELSTHLVTGVHAQISFDAVAEPITTSKRKMYRAFNFATSGYFNEELQGREIEQFEDAWDRMSL